MPVPVRTASLARLRKYAVLEPLFAQMLVSFERSILGDFRLTAKVGRAANRMPALGQTIARAAMTEPASRADAHSQNATQYSAKNRGFP
jgi:hypothetical protein